MRAFVHAFVLVTATVSFPAAVRADSTTTGDVEALKRQVDDLARQNQDMQRTIRSLEAEVLGARDEARAASDLARGRAAGSDPYAERQAASLLEKPLGNVARLQLLDVSLDVLSAMGGSSASDEELESLQGGEHDPRQRGFTLQQAELGFKGAVDPYFTGEAYLVYFLDAEGESNFEVEEAFATTQRLPFGLEERGLQLELGQFFTEFGRLNALHPHAWDWQDQPIVLSRFLGGDGMRQTGVAARWLTPLPWFSELIVTTQNANGETMVSFLANDEVFEERPIGGRPFDDPAVSSLADLVYTTRLVNGFDLSDTWSAQIGGTWATGPNATDGRTHIYGADLVVKWLPLQTDRGWPYVKIESELLYRRYKADGFFGCAEADEDPCTDPLDLGGEVLRDWGFYSQIVWGFRRGWSTGLRVEHATGSGDSFDTETGTFVSHDDDAYRSNRWRLSPLIAFYPSEFSRLRLQYNYDHANDLRDDDAHTVWAGFEFLFGSHPAHVY
jgi:hypothetical protein